MRQIALTASAIVFFAMAGAAALAGQTSWLVALRCLGGAAIAFIAATVGLKLAVSVMIQAVVAAPPGSENDEETENSEPTRAES